MTSAFQRHGSDRYIGHWSLLPRRATELIAASLIQRASADNISRKFCPKSGPTKCLKLVKLTVFLTFIIHLNLHVKTKAPMGLRGRSGWSLLLTKSGFSRL